MLIASPPRDMRANHRVGMLPSSIGSGRFWMSLTVEKSALNTSKPPPTTCSPGLQFASDAALLPSTKFPTLTTEVDFGTGAGAGDGSGTGEGSGVATGGVGCC